MTTRWIAALTFAAAIAVGCGDDKAAAPKAAPQAKKPAPETAAPVEIPDEDLPVEGDFEDEAETQITAENYKQELDGLAGEIEAEEAP